MAEWIKANTNAPGDKLPDPYVPVAAKDDQGSEFVAMLTVPGYSWAYGDEKRYGVAACVEYWRHHQAQHNKAVQANAAPMSRLTTPHNGQPCP